jgi:hypothetical protein
MPSFNAARPYGQKDFKKSADPNVTAFDKIGRRKLWQINKEKDCSYTVYG